MVLGWLARRFEQQRAKEIAVTTRAAHWAKHKTNPANICKRCGGDGEERFQGGVSLTGREMCFDCGGTGYAPLKCEG